MSLCPRSMVITNKMKRIIYLLYYLKNLDLQKFKLFLSYASKNYSISKNKLLVDVFKSSVKYKISLLEYFQFRFFEMKETVRKTYAGTGYMYEYQLIMNPRKHRVILDDKTQFYRKYNDFIKHTVADIKDLKADSRLSDLIIHNLSGKIVFKIYNGKCGQQVRIMESREFNCQKSLLDFMTSNGFDIAEEFIVQHPALMELSPSAVNTVRIFTQLNTSDEVDILGCRLRISVGSQVDNMAAGNIAATIDESTGILSGPGVYSDITKPEEFKHPVTGIIIPGFKIPYWKETMEMVKRASLAHMQNRSIGWDIAITEKGPDLIEGNHDWCKLVWQLPVKKGMKPILEKYLEDYKNNNRGSLVST